MGNNGHCQGCGGQDLSSREPFGWVCDYCVTIHADQMDEECDVIVRRLRHSFSEDWELLRKWAEERQAGIGSFKHEAVVIDVEAMHLLINEKVIFVDKIDLSAIDANRDEVMKLIKAQLHHSYATFEPAQTG